MSTAYVLKTNGSIVSKIIPRGNVNDLTSVDINPAYQVLRTGPCRVLPTGSDESGVYMYPIDDHFFIMHPDNDLDLATTGITVNQALRRRFPQSPFVGDILVVSVDTDDNLRIEPWSLDDLGLDGRKMLIDANLFQGAISIVNRDVTEEF